MSKQDILPIKFDVESILASLDIRYETSNGKIAKIVKGVASLADASKDDLSFCSSNGEYGAYMISKSDAGTITSFLSAALDSIYSNTKFLYF
jgi:hypothetical protein